MPLVEEGEAPYAHVFTNVTAIYNPVPGWIATAREGKGNIATLMIAIEKYLSGDFVNGTPATDEQWKAAGVPGGKDDLIAEFYTALERNKASACNLGM